MQTGSWRSCPWCPQCGGGFCRAPPLTGFKFRCSSERLRLLESCSASGLIHELRKKTLCLCQLLHSKVALQGLAPGGAGGGVGHQCSGGSSLQYSMCRSTSVCGHVNVQRCCFTIHRLLIISSSVNVDRFVRSGHVTMTLFISHLAC